MGHSPTCISYAGFIDSDPYIHTCIKSLTQVKTKEHVWVGAHQKAYCNVIVLCKWMISIHLYRMHITESLLKTIVNHSLIGCLLTYYYRHRLLSHTVGLKYVHPLVPKHNRWGFCLQKVNWRQRAVKILVIVGINNSLINSLASCKIVWGGEHDIIRSNDLDIR